MQYNSMMRQAKGRVHSISLTIHAMVVCLWKPLKNGGALAMLAIGVACGFKVDLSVGLVYHHQPEEEA